MSSEDSIITIVSKVLQTQFTGVVNTLVLSRGDIQINLPKCYRSPGTRFKSLTP